MTSFPVEKINLLAERESWRKELNRPIYHIHKWWAQRLGSVFRALIIYILGDKKIDVWDAFYKKNNFSNAIVLDPFMGSGTTIGEALKLGASAIGCDINPISSFLVKQELTHIPLDDLTKAYAQIEASVSSKILKYYQTKDEITGEDRQVLYYFWVKIVKTPSGEDIPLFSRYVFAQNAYASQKPTAQIVCPYCWSIFTGLYNDTEAKCPHCSYVFNPQKGPANNTTVTDSKGKQYKIKSLIPQTALLPEKMYACLSIDKNGNKKYQKTTGFDFSLYQDACSELQKHHFYTPSYPVECGFNTDQARGYNYLNWKDFFNNRQLLCLGYLLDAILHIENEDIKEQFLCLFSSTLEFNNMFCSYKGEGTGAVRPIFSNHILKPERTPLENSVWGHSSSSGCFSTLFNSRLLRAKKYLDYPFELYVGEAAKSEKIVASEPIKPHIFTEWQAFEGSKHSALILNGDSSSLSIPDGVIDCVITDPPYFDFIHYSELSDFFYAWLSPILKGKYQFFTPISSRRKNEVQNTDVNIFSRLLSRVFRESFRVLKTNGKLAFSFHHSRISGWLAITRALVNAGFYISEVFPVHAELMASTPKSATNEPISIDAMIICSKELCADTREDVVSRCSKLIQSLSNKKSFSKTDVFVIIASQSIKYIVNNRLTDIEASFFIEVVSLEIRHNNQ